MKILYIILFLFCFNPLNGQLQKAHWFFGEYAGVDFTSGVPVADINGQLSTWEGSTAISDELGNLMFYSDGKIVYDRNHNVMPNGTGLFGHYSSPQSGIVLPKLDNCDQYYLFTIDAGYGIGGDSHHGLNYSVIDMTLNGGLGDVVPDQKNILVPLDSSGTPKGYERLTAVVNANKDGYWLLTQYTTKFYAFEITEAGINPNPVTSQHYFNTTNNIGMIKASVDGSRLAVSKGGNFNTGGLAVYNFDNSTGIISNEIIVNQDRHYYGIEFSPNGDILYANFINHLVQYDLNSVPISNSEYAVDMGIYEFQLLLGPDGKIYFPQNAQPYLGCIENPDISYNPVTDEAPVYDLNAVYLGGRIATLGLPQFLTSYFRVSSLFINGEINTGSYCQLAELDFSFCARGEVISSILWDFGDGTTSTEENPVKVYDQPGHYTVTLTLIVDGEPYIKTIEFEILEAPTIEIQGDYEFCESGETELFAITDEENIVNWYENEEDELPIYTGNPFQTPMLTSTTTYWVEAVNVLGCPSERLPLTVEITEPEIPGFTLPQSLCYGEEFILPIESDNGITGSWSPEFNNTETTTYTFTPDEGQCVSAELTTVTIEILPLPELTINGTFEICIGTSVVLEILTDMENTVNWYENETDITPIYTGNPFTTPVLTETTSYWAEAVSEAGCVSERIEVTVEVTESIVPEFELQTQYCQNTEPQELPTTSDNGITGSWFPAAIDTSTAGTQTYIFTPDEGQCATDSEMTVEVVETPELVLPDAPEICSGETATITITTTGETVNWYEDEFSTTPFHTGITYTTPPLTESATYWIEAANGECISERLALVITVNELPEMEAENPDPICVGNSVELSVLTNGEIINWYDSEDGTTPIYTGNPFTTPILTETTSYWAEAVSETGCISERIEVTVEVTDSITPIFDLQHQYCLDADPQELPTTSDNGITGSWFPATIDTSTAGTQTYTFTPDEGQCSEVYPITIETAESTAPVFSDLPEIYCFNSEAEALPAVSDNGISGSWYPGEINTGIQGITGYVFTPDGNQCSESYELVVTVYPYPDMELEDDIVICSGDSYSYLAPEGFDYYIWTDSFGNVLSETREIIFTEEGVYTLTVEINGIPCTLSRNIEVSFSTTPIITEIKSTESTLTVYATGDGPFEYSLDEIFWQSSNVFYNLEPGIYFVYVRDGKGCGSSAKQGAIMGVPNFISPNGDGKNDTWKIRALAGFPNTRLQIFDRYGKMFVDRILDGDFEWDGRYNREPLPSGTYWYILILEDGEKLSGHINLRNY